MSVERFTEDSQDKQSNLLLDLRSMFTTFGQVVGQLGNMNGCAFSIINQ